MAEYKYGTWERERDQPEHRYEDVFIPIISDERIRWNPDKITPSTSVCIYQLDDALYTRELMTCICNPESNIDLLLERAKSVTLCVSYWVLVDLRDESLDAERLECELEDERMPEFHPDTGLGHLVPMCRDILQKFTNLHVYFNETHMGCWNPCCLAIYTGVLRTFTNISDYDYSQCDKYGPLIIYTIEDVYRMYGVTTDRVVFLHGRNDWCDDGQSSETHRYIELAQEGLFDGDWTSLDPFKKPYIPYMRFRELPLSSLPLAAEYPKLCELDAEVIVDTPSIILPDCPELQRLVIEYNGPDYSPSQDFRITIRGCKKLRCIEIFGNYDIRGDGSKTRVSVIWEDV